MPAARQKVHREDFPRLVAVSVLWIAIPFTLFPLAVQHIASGVTGLINGALPIFAVAFGSIMLRRAPGRMQTLGLALGFVGIMAIALPSFSEGSSEAIGVLMALLAVVCYGIAVNIVAPLTQRYGSLPVMARVVGLAVIWTLPFGVASIPQSSFAWPSFLAVAVLGVLGTGVAFVLMGQLIARVGARASFADLPDPGRGVDPGRRLPRRSDPRAVRRRHRVGDRRRAARIARRSATHERPTATRPSWSSILRQPR